MKPLLNGREIGGLHNVRGGKDVAVLLDRLIDWQLEHPTGTAQDYRNDVQGGRL
jgi:hypothetical protein